MDRFDVAIVGAGPAGRPRPSIWRFASEIFQPGRCSHTSFLPEGLLFPPEGQRAPPSFDLSPPMAEAPGFSSVRASLSRSAPRFTWSKEREEEPSNPNCGISALEANCMTEWISKAGTISSSVFASIP